MLLPLQEFRCHFVLRKVLQQIKCNTYVFANAVEKEPRKRAFQTNTLSLRVTEKTRFFLHAFPTIQRLPTQPSMFHCCCPTQPCHPCSTLGTPRARTTPCSRRAGAGWSRMCALEPAPGWGLLPRSSWAVSGAVTALRVAHGSGPSGPALGRPSPAAPLPCRTPGSSG